jgi:PPP family 3-phenylpropionic acid transporter
LSLFYFFYFASLGAMLPYWSLYLSSLGYDAREIGWLMAILTGTRIIAPNFWGWLSDRFKRRLGFIRFGALSGFLLFSGITLADELFWIALVIFAYSFFWSAILSQFEVVTLNHLEHKRETYSHVRLWGSIGFIFAVGSLGLVFDLLEISYLPVFVAVLMLCIWLSTLFIWELPEVARQPGSGGVWAIIKSPEVFVFFVVFFLLQVSHGPYYVFFSVYLEAHHYSKAMIGFLWSLGVIAEVVLFIFMHRLLVRFYLRQIILVSLLLTTVRWYAIANGIDNLPLLLAVQCLHALSFGAMHAAGIELVQRLFGRSHPGQGQALYSALTFGLGGAVGAGASGYLWVSTGPVMTFNLAAGVSFIALLMAYFWFSSEKFQ